MTLYTMYDDHISDCDYDDYDATMAMVKVMQQ